MKALSFDAIQDAVSFTKSVYPGDAFYTDFSNVRGTFTDSRVYKTLGINPSTGTCTATDSTRSEIVYLAGHRGSGKTTELNRLVCQIEKWDCYFPITCNVDQFGLDLDNIHLVDVLMCVLEVLTEKVMREGINIEQSTLKLTNDWFTERITEVSQAERAEIKMETTAEAGIGLPFFIKLIAKLRSSLSGTDEKKNIIRTTFLNRFTEFAGQVNILLGEVENSLQRMHKAPRLLLIMDGFEKIGSLESRRRIVLDDSERLRQINVRILMTLPIELIVDVRKLQEYSRIIMFPVIKLLTPSGEIIAEAVNKFKEFIYKRVDESLFDQVETVEMVLCYSGGSPREALQILDQAYIEATKNVIDNNAVTSAVMGLAAAASYLSETEMEKLYSVEEELQGNGQAYYDATMQTLLEKRWIYEYNNGTYRRINPILKKAKGYQDYVKRKRKN